MWRCKQCGEEIEDQFNSCWKCAESTLPDPGDTLPKYSAKCHACGSENVVKGVKTVDRELLGSREQSVIYDGQGKGQAFLPKITKSNIVAVVCGDCGFTSFYSTNYKAIYRHFSDEMRNDNA
jgi:predicted nucleic-acid-binding Zn-ribbon protein